MFEDELSIDQILDEAALPQQSVPICMRADLLSQIQERERKILQLKSDDDDLRMVEQSEFTAAELADEIRALEAEAARYTVNLRLQAVDRYKWNKQTDAAKTEDEDSGTEKLDLNALVEAVFDDSLVSPAMSKTQQEKFLAKITEGQWESIIQAVWDLNRTVTTVGKSVTASLALMKRGEKPGPEGL